MKASDVMTRSVITISEEASIAEALQLMLGKAVSGLPVLDHRARLVGIITEGDLLRRAEMALGRHIAWWKNLLFGPCSSAREYVRSHARSVGSVMTREILCIAENTALERIEEMMEQGQVKRLPVMRGRKLIGIVSRRDLIKPRSAVIEEPTTSQAGDARIPKLIHEELARRSWDPRHYVTMVVSRGVVQLSGTVFGEEQLQALRVTIENTPGVREIRSEIVVLDPLLGKATASPIDLRSDGIDNAGHSHMVSA